VWCSVNSSSTSLSTKEMTLDHVPLSQIWRPCEKVPTLSWSHSSFMMVHAHESVHQSLVPSEVHVHYRRTHWLLHVHYYRWNTIHYSWIPCSELWSLHLYTIASRMDERILSPCYLNEVGYNRSAIKTHLHFPMVLVAEQQYNSIISMSMLHDITDRTCS
jgi:hypothetical protein